MSSIPDVPVNVLLDCSKTTLQGIALNAENQAANLRKQKKEIEEEIVQWRVRAQIAWWIANQREEMVAQILRTEDSQYAFNFRYSEGGDPTEKIGIRDRLARAENSRAA